MLITADLAEQAQRKIDGATAHFWSVPDTLTCVCALALDTGTVVIGSASMDGFPEFDVDTCRKAAFDAACDRVLELERYAMAERPRVVVASLYDMPTRGSK